MCFSLKKKQVPQDGGGYLAGFILVDHFYYVVIAVLTRCSLQNCDKLRIGEISLKCFNRGWKMTNKFRKPTATEKKRHIPKC